jgi:uncharacterized damage-inducible protein DinB
MQLSHSEAQLLQKLALDMLEHESKTTSRVIEAIPAANVNYKPDAASMTSLELAKHIASSEMDFLHSVVKGNFEFGTTVPETANTPGAVAAWYTQEVEKVAAEIKALPAEKAAQIMDFRGFMQMPAIMFVNFILRHSIHHRGQLSAHLRAAGGKCPSIYGPSYEDQQKQKQATAN